MSMEEFGGGLGEDIGSAQTGSESSESSESKEQAIARIEKEQKKASQTRGQIIKDKKNNAALAQFLTFLFQSINNEKIILLFHDVFFHKSKTGGTYVNHKVFAGMLAPFFWLEAQQMGVDKLYREMYEENTISGLQPYIDYLKKISYTYHDNIALNQQGLLQLIIEVLKNFSVIETNEYTDEQKKDFIISIVHDLFGIQHTIDVKK